MSLQLNHEKALHSSICVRNEVLFLAQFEIPFVDQQEKITDD